MGRNPMINPVRSRNHIDTNEMSRGSIFVSASGHIDHLCQCERHSSIFSHCLSVVSGGLVVQQSPTDARPMRLIQLSALRKNSTASPVSCGFLKCDEFYLRGGQAL